MQCFRASESSQNTFSETEVTNRETDSRVVFVLFCLHATLGYHNVLLEWKFMKLLLKRRAADSIENEDERAL